MRARRNAYDEKQINKDETSQNVGAKCNAYDVNQINKDETSLLRAPYFSKF
jgi:hypothetical protein